MAIDTTTPRSRRALLMGAVGAAAAGVAATVARVAPVEGANGNPIVIGSPHNVGTASTRLTKSGAGSAFEGRSTGNGVGIFGNSNSGTGTWGQSTSGTGVGAFSDSGVALHVTTGRIKINQVSGVATIAKGRRSVTVNPGVDINADTFVLLTPKANIGARALWYSTKTNKNHIVINMSATRGVPTKIAWVALEKA